MNDFAMPQDAQAALPLEARLLHELQQLPSLCPGLLGAALATSDGLPLCATGALRGDDACATAAFLLAEFDTNLAVVRTGRTREVLAWTDTGPLYLARIGALPYMLALLAGPVPAAAVRHAGALAAARLAEALATLETP